MKQTALTVLAAWGHKDKALPDKGKNLVLPLPPGHYDTVTVTRTDQKSDRGERLYRFVLTKQ